MKRDISDTTISGYIKATGHAPTPSTPPQPVAPSELIHPRKPTGVPESPTPTKPTIMARLAKLQQKLFLTPAQSRAAAQAQLDRINLVLAGEREALRNSILALVSEKTKTTKLAFEVKLTINRAALDTLIGDDAAVHIALAVAKRIIAQHEKLKANTVKATAMQGNNRDGMKPVKKEKA